ncbi:MAG: DUF429 domain-containing protein [Chloroflexota bacterium]|nr:DUF429 domain-containing protein [Chloroflexota bacterium]
MPEKSPVYVGVMILRNAGRVRRPFVYAALDARRELLALCRGDRAEVLAYLGGQRAAVAAIDAPRGPNTGVVNDAATYQQGLPFEKPRRAINARLSECLLRESGCPVDATPSKVRDCPKWKRVGFDLFRRLAEYGYQPFPNQDGEWHSLETRVEAVFWRLLGGKLPLPESLEGRLQRQLILHDLACPVPDAMDFFLEITRHKLILGDLPDEEIFSFNELNALMVAYMAWAAAHQPDDLDLLGDLDEGQIALPKNALFKSL